MSSVEGEARRALNRLRRSIEKSGKELESLIGALRHVEGEDFPAGLYAEARDRLHWFEEMLDVESGRLQEKLLQAGGLEPGRIRRRG